MKKLTLSSAPLIVILALALAPSAQAEEGKPARIVTGMIKSEVIVEKIDYETRQIKVIDASGNRFTIVADEAVSNMDRIQPRDRIVTEYMESIAIFVTPDGALELPDAAVGAISPEGEEPAIAGLESSMIKASIKSIDRTSRRVILQDENGNTSSFKVAPETPLDNVDIGDEVRVRLTRAVAITIEHPKN